MRVAVDQIRAEGLVIESELNSGALALDTELAEVAVPLRLRVSLRRVNDVVTARMEVNGVLSFVCCRCLSKFETCLNKEFTNDYPLDKGERFIDLDPDLRDFIMLEYPMNPLCKQDCRGICPKCGVNLNEAAACNCK